MGYLCTEGLIGNISLNLVSNVSNSIVTNFDALAIPLKH